MNTYCKIPQYGLNTSNYDFLEDIPFDPISIEFIPGCEGDCSQLNCYCLTRSGYHQFELHNTFEFIDGRTICSRLYQIEQLPGLGKSTLWMTYKGQIISNNIKQLNIKFIYSEKGTNNWWAFLKMLWPSQNISTLIMSRNHVSNLLMLIQIMSARTKISDFN